MAGNAEGGRKAARTNQSKYGNDFYTRIGKQGGKRGRTGGFASPLIGEDGLTGKQRARTAGYKGGTVSRRKGKAIDTFNLENQGE